MSGLHINNRAQIQVLSASRELEDWLAAECFTALPFRADMPADFLVLGDDYAAHRAMLHHNEAKTPCALCLTQPFNGSYIETFQLGISHLIFINEPGAAEALTLALLHAKSPRLDITSYPEFVNPPVEISSLHQSIETRGDLELTMEASRNFLREAGLSEDRLQNILLCQKEAVTNAVFHGFKVPASTGSSKYDAQEFDRLTDGDSVQIRLVRSPEWINLVVQDNSGKLGPLRVVNSLDRHHMSQGLLDTRGRGFFLMHQLADRSIVNIQRQVTTQMSLYFNLPTPSNLHHFQLIIKN